LAVTLFPTDEALRLLLARLDDWDDRPAIQEALNRYPAPALRLLAHPAAESVTQVGGVDAPPAEMPLTESLEGSDQ
jgi:hypothetical protein